MTLIYLLFSLALPSQAVSDTLAAVDLYGLRSVAEASVRAAVGVRAGDPVPQPVEAIRARVSALAGVAEVDVTLVCCSGNGGKLLYVGIREEGVPPMTYRAAPAGDALLPAEIVSVGSRFETALIRAVQRGAAGEDQSRGYSLAEDSLLRAVQSEFIQIAAGRFTTLVAVLHGSSDAAHRALAAQIIAYGASRPDVARQLLFATSDPHDGVRNNAVRALAVLATWAQEHPDSGVVIPAEPFMELLNSVAWTDRNKGLMVLVPLTASRDPALLAELRTRALPALVEMARWTDAGHALGPYIVLARMAGVEDDEAFRAWQAGEREAVIARARRPAR